MTQISFSPVGGTAPPASPLRPDSPAVEAGKTLEQALWTEMLKHAGLEDALAQGAGESASAFARYALEAIAVDLAERAPLGVGEGFERREVGMVGPESGGFDAS